MNSLSDGMMREFLRRDDDGAGAQQCFDLISDFYRAVALVFPDAWAAKHTPKTSRLVHGAGIVALGYVMEVWRCSTARAARRSSLRAWAASRTARPGHRANGTSATATAGTGKRSRTSIATSSSSLST